jgi:alkylation response protein AidB-like acyl-CoA dehydrogenase
MDFGWDQEYVDFRREVRDFITEFRTPEMVEELEQQYNEAGRGRGGAHIEAFRKELNRRGYLRMCWPEKYGGQGKSPFFQFILIEELDYAGMPYGSLSVTSIAPSIMAFGTDEQRQKYLPGIWSGEMSFAIGYSEPNAGTDLASLQTRAVRDGDEWVINGQKMWTSQAHVATHIWLAARTDPDAPKHRGVSVIIVPVDTPGVSVRPLIGMSGLRTNETFYEDVRVPAANLVGEENRGWYIVAHALDHERVGIAPNSGLAKSLDLMVDYVRVSRPDLLEDPTVRKRLAEIKVELHMQRALATENAWIIASGRTPTKEASMTKIWSSELRYRMNSIAMDLLGRYGGLSRESGDLAPAQGRIESTYRGSPVLRFGGGTNEVQRNIIAQRGLGLPRG